jgi:glycerol-3-phosphate acyltransferase PlsY
MASVFLGFRGGKGVATAFGGLIAMWPTLGLAALAAFAAWIVVVLPTRMVSLASMVAAIVLPAVAVGILLSADVPDSIPPSDVWPRRLPAIIVSSLIGAMVLWRHRSNLARIISRTESRIGQ